jgi:hypothetical protein
MLFKCFLFFLASFLSIYLLTGFGILTFLPGGILLILLMLTIFTGLIWGIRKTLGF